ncbi:STAS domain-containing protein [Acinetobacter sp. WZC-1]|uniref:STAS domain-containing protein n=1 Tax=Acinetobacter sp. WZC-1 TaxID=3459034 RepID=UPI00403DBD72
MIEFKDQQLHVSGKIGFDNAENMYQNGLKAIQAEHKFPVTVNLSQLEQGNTLALAVLVQWLRHTPDARGLRLKAVPDKMLKIIQACHLQDDLQIM